VLITESSSWAAGIGAGHNHTFALVGEVKADDLSEAEALLVAGASLKGQKLIATNTLNQDAYKRLEG